MLKQKLAASKLSIGSWMSLPSPAIAEILSSAALDFVVVDMEHSAMSLRECEELIRVISLKGKAPLVRLSSIDPVQAKRVMDSGAEGVLVPMVKSQKEANSIVESIHYPPRGIRGVGLARAQKYGPGFKRYFYRSSKKGIVIVQIEHIDAVNNFEEILSTDGVDAFIIGPYDLTASMGIAGEFEHPDYLAVLEKIQKLTAKNNYIAGIHIVEPDIGELKKRVNDGYKFIAYSVDFRMVDSAMRSGLSAIGHGETRE